MSEQPEGTGGKPGYDPDFELPHHGVIREDNWTEYQAKGYVPVPEDLKGAQNVFGTEHVFTGDAYDPDEERPLRHKPGVGVYVDPEGLKHWEEKKRRYAEDDRQSQSGGEPDAS
jgi:hypothetical protein